METRKFSYNSMPSNRSSDTWNGDKTSGEVSRQRSFNRNRPRDSKRHLDSQRSNMSAPIDRNGRNSFRQPRLLYSEDEEEELSVSLRNYYGKDLNALLATNFESKKYSFSASGVKLSSPDLLFTEEKWPNDKLPELQSVKRTLNAVKSKLDEYELSHWHKHTRAMNPADKVMKHLRRDVKVEFLTQAWCKFYELVNKYRLIPTEALASNEFFSYHLCEAPGAFVASLNHYLKLNNPKLKWYWRANSLNPFYEGNDLSMMINDDRFILQTIDEWDFGPDMTGDITHPDYPKYLRYNFGDSLPHLVTADGSFDCQDNPEEQESMVSWLHLKEALNALNILRKNGNFVIKMFTFFECDTICLLTLLAAAFETINVEKPATSKEGNSEVYVVCQRFKGRDAIRPWLDRLMVIDLETYQRFSMFPLASCSRTFYREITQCAKHFASFQINVIERNIRIYHDDPEDFDLRKHCDFLQEKFVQHYIKKYHLRPISMEDNIVKLPKFKYQVDRKVPQVIESRDRKQGSHNERVQRSTLMANDLLEKITEELEDGFCNNLSTELQLPRGCEVPIEAFHINCGKPIPVVRSSQFCHGRFMRIRNELINVYGSRKYNIASHGFPEGRGNQYPNYHDFSALYMEKDNNTAQRESYQIICSKLNHLQEGDNFQMVAFPLLTQFNIDVLCILRQIFKEVIFNAPNTLILVNLQRDKLNLWRNKLAAIREVYTPNRAVISFLPVSFITGCHNSFYKWLVDTNNSRLYHEINNVIDFRPKV